jgi:hypothetical protein
MKTKLSRKRLEYLLNYCDGHLFEAINTIVKVDMIAKDKLAPQQKIRNINRIIQGYKSKNKGVIEF